MTDANHSDRTDHAGRTDGGSSTDRKPFDPAALEAVCFDLDDTLFDFRQYVEQGLSNAAEYVKTRTGESVHDELYELYFEEDVRDRTFDRLVERRGLDLSVEALVEAYHGASGPLDPYDDAEPVLEPLTDEYKLGLVTDGRNGHEKLARLGLERFFDAVVVTHDHGLAKRSDTEAFERILDELDVDPAAAVYVGDHPTVDLRLPVRLGMRTVRLRRGRYSVRESGVSPDAEIDSLGPLAGLCGVDIDGS